MRKCIALLALAGTAGSALAGGTVIGRDISTDTGIFLSRTSNVGPGVFSDGMILSGWGPGDMFGIAFRGIGGSGLPFAVADDSVTIFTADTLGIIAEDDFDPFFGSVDTVNSANPNAVSTATWSFDISGFTGLEFSADFAAMGDFESSDTHLFEYQIDGGGWVTLLASSVDEAGSLDYFMDSGTLVTLNDPMLLGGNLLTNEFQNISAAIAGSGSVLEIRYSAAQDAGSEAFVFRNLEITGVPAPGSLALLGLGGLAAARRRRV